MNEAEFICLAVQAFYFEDEIKQLRSHNVVGLPSARSEVTLRHQTLKSNSSLCRLDPFLDLNGILRVGGRIKNANVAESL